MAEGAPPDPYGALGLERDAPADEVRRAYRRAALRLHPDKSGGDAAAFQRATAAYELLSDPERRAHFDRFGHDRAAAGPPHQHQHHHPFFGGGFGGFGGFGGPTMDDLLREMMGGGGGGATFVFRGPGGEAHAHAPAAAAVDRVEVELTAPEFYLGCARRVEVDAPERCGACAGTGAASPDDLLECVACGGRGRAPPPPGFPFGLFPTPPCGSCAGKGRAFRTPRRCGACGGARCVPRRRAFEVRVPPGVPDGTEQVLRGRGGYDPDAGAPRDLAIRFRFRAMPPDVEGVDAASGEVRMRVRLELGEVLCGFTRALDLFGTGAVELSAPAYAPPDRVAVLAGRGLPPAGAPAGAPRGDVRVRFEVAWPQDDRQLAKYRDVLERIFVALALPKAPAVRRQPRGARGEETESPDTDGLEGGKKEPAP